MLFPLPRPVFQDRIRFTYPYQGAPLEAHGRDRQPCRVHMRRTFTRRLRKLPEEVRERYAPRLKRLGALLRELPAEGAASLMGWLEEAVDPAAPVPKEWRRRVAQPAAGPPKPTGSSDR